MTATRTWFLTKVLQTDFFLQILKQNFVCISFIPHYMVNRPVWFILLKRLRMLKACSVSLDSYLEPTTYTPVKAINSKLVELLPMSFQRSIAAVQPLWRQCVAEKWVSRTTLLLSSRKLTLMCVIFKRTKRRIGGSHLCASTSISTYHRHLRFICIVWITPSH
jgi:hypothetical protein